MRYSAERNKAVLKKMLQPNNRSIRELAEEEGISAATLYNRRKSARRAQTAVVRRFSDTGLHLQRQRTRPRPSCTLIPAARCAGTRA